MTNNGSSEIPPTILDRKDYSGIGKGMEEDVDTAQ